MFGGIFFDGYPWIPWIAVIGVGYLLGAVLMEQPEQRRRKLLTVGAITTVAFLILRLVNHYGDPNPWKHQASAIMTFCSFFNVTKQPPSLIFLAMTLGPVVMALVWFDRPLPKWRASSRRCIGRSSNGSR